jgi:ligand-binding SRPBCC domain-containing protein
MATVHLKHDYPLTPAALFSRVVRYDELADAMRGIATYEGLPEGEARVGQVFTVKVRLLGWLPTPPWTISVIQRDDAAHVLRSVECGGPAKSWRHKIQIVDGPGGAIMHDTVEIDAGLLTGFYTGQAQSMYRARHAARRRLLGLNGRQTLSK